MIRTPGFVQPITATVLRALRPSHVGRSSGGHPLGPLVRRNPAHHPTTARCLAVLVLSGCVVLLSVAVTLTPDPAGLGTHQQLSMLPCSLPLVWGYPCPTCGMTTAFVHTVRGSFLSAFHTQPAGFVFALATAVVGGGALCIALTGKGWRVNWYRIHPSSLALLIVGLVLGGWLYKLGAGILSGTLPVR